MDDQALSNALAAWREWCRRDDADLGYPSRAAGIRYSPGRDWDALVDSLDETVALAVDAAVDDLPLMERTAVHAVVLGPMVWRLREPVHEVYGRAREALKVKLRARGIE